MFLPRTGMTSIFHVVVTPEPMEPYTQHVDLVLEGTPFRVYSVWKGIQTNHSFEEGSLKQPWGFAFGRGRRRAC